MSTKITLRLNTGWSKVIKKVKFSPVHAVKAYRGSRVIAPLFLRLSARR
jgi:hypothetical protein